MLCEVLTMPRNGTASAPNRCACGEPANYGRGGIWQCTFCWQRGWLVAVADTGHRMGEGHGLAKLSDRDVELIVSLLEIRADLTRSSLESGMSPSQVDRLLCDRQLSYRWIGWKFDVNKTCVKKIADGRIRGGVAAGWKRVRVG